MILFYNPVMAAFPPADAPRHVAGAIKKYVLTADRPAEKIDEYERAVGAVILRAGTIFTICSEKSTVPGYPPDRTFYTILTSSTSYRLEAQVLELRMEEFQPRAAGTRHPFLFSPRTLRRFARATVKWASNS